MLSRFLQPISFKFKEWYKPEEKINTVPTYIENIQNQFKTNFNLNNFVNSPDKEPDNNSDKVKQISIWFACGYTSGFTLRKASKIGIIVFGTTFIGLQFLSYYNYININHQKIESDITNIFDLNKDGKVDNEDLMLHYHNLRKVLEFNIPAGCGYSAGFLLGLKHGG